MVSINKNEIWEVKYTDKHNRNSNYFAIYRVDNILNRYYGGVIFSVAKLILLKVNNLPDYLKDGCYFKIGSILYVDTISDRNNIKKLFS